MPKIICRKCAKEYHLLKPVEFFICGCGEVLESEGVARTDRDDKEFIAYYETYFAGTIIPNFYDPGNIITRHYVRRSIVQNTGRLLNIGCGIGDLFGRTTSFENYGLDISANTLRTASKLFSACYLTCDAEQLPFENESFDVVTSVHCFEHLQSDERAAAEAWRVLKPGGEFVLYVPGRPDGILDQESFERFRHLRNYNEASLTTLLSDKFKIQSITRPSVLFNILWLPLKKLVMRFETLFNLLDFRNFSYYFSRYILRKKYEDIKLLAKGKKHIYERLSFRFLLAPLVIGLLFPLDLLLSKFSFYLPKTFHCNYLVRCVKPK